MGSPSSKAPLQAFIAACLLFATPAIVLANTGLTSVSDAEQKVFRFNVGPNGYPPYLITGNDEPGGIMWSVVDEIGRRLGYLVEAHQFPHKRVEQMLVEGKLDGTARAKEWTERPQDFVFTDPIVKSEEVIFFPSDSPHKFEVIEDLFSLTIVTHLGYRYPNLEPHFASGEIKRFDVTSDRNVLNYTMKGQELDAAVSDRLVGQWILRQEGIQNKFRASSASISEVGYRIMLRPGMETFAEAFNRELANMRSNGELDDILSRYR
ncbi:transporter substrate-binding domain-containing protein [Marinobacter sp. CHS3-4]|uniref:substrate-binding periplasmic protein n=1 Tax=Marinobacter sp. CHS3-4 TaxID=3045174 RepID=UPI0024B56E31|nr:transporter substrate-binding domain-containing protein [Marinobacter sp. CHS3-4]MDI9246916.1 transporter substrate-binding domain-containing protein [Marinobacter sp. CHS3-4]